MRAPTFNPDTTRKNDAPYWGAALMLAIREDDAARAKKATANLRRLGYEIKAAKIVKAVAND
jgi:hypothetical protein